MAGKRSWHRESVFFGLLLFCLVGLWVCFVVFSLGGWLVGGSRRPHKGLTVEEKWRWDVEWLCGVGERLPILQ